MTESINWSPGVKLEDIEKEVILRAFRHFRSNKVATCNALGIAVRTLDNKLEKYEADGKRAKEQTERERAERTAFLERQRGIAGNSQALPGTTQGQTESANGDGSASWVSVESASDASSKPAVSVPKRQEIQGVPSQHAPQGRAKGSR